ncbi:MAG: universal stress protein [Deltaproteobacteria bacterium]|nr:universal stress protein [Deltaproteobacteria bacterium]
MDKIHKILAPTDLSEISQAGVRYALNLARAVGAEVTVYQVLSPEEVMQYVDKLKQVEAGEPAQRLPSPILQRYEAVLARFLSDNFSDLIPWLKVREKVEVGRPDKAIVQRAKIEGSDLIVIATHGRSGLAHILLGSVTEKVVRTAPCPVLTVHPRTGKEAITKYATSA